MDMGSLPVELWRVILAYLPLPDLGRCCQVCRAWRELIFSLDNTRWRQLCLGCPECRHPNWPSQPYLEPASWREALKQHALATRTWTRNGQELQSSACLLFFRRRKDRRVWHVGPGCEFETLRGALAVVGPYDRVALHPGVYEEQAEVALKVPVELVGVGRLGEVALLVCIEQQCSTARLCNLVFMPPWFSTVGSSTHLLSVVLSLLDSCDFSGSDTASVTVEGPPASERNWACKHLAALARTFPAQSNSTPKGPEGSSTGEPDPSSGNVKRENMNMEDWKRRTGGNAACRGTVIEDGWSDGEHTEGEEENQEAIDNTKKFFTLDYKIPYNHHGLSHLLKTRADGSLPPASSPVPPSVTPEPLTLQQELDRDPEAQMLASSILGCILRRCLFRDGKGGVHLSNYGQARLEENVFRGLNYAVRCIQHSTVN
ncbi:hypothetical protein GOODEAATRI_017440 [Goodea atripinnis]|uniref:F-box domain-containing protein n=1 Tax=Goodea atripinnis TaxID=208336 RepID=A0ABV0NBD7_9TELE